MKYSFVGNGQLHSVIAPSYDDAYALISRDGYDKSTVLVPIGDVDITDFNAVKQAYDENKVKAQEATKILNEPIKNKIEDQSKAIKQAQYEAQPDLNPDFSYDESHTPLLSEKYASDLGDAAARGLAKFIVPHEYEAEQAGDPTGGGGTAGAYDIVGMLSNLAPAARLEGVSANFLGKAANKIDAIKNANQSFSDVIGKGGLSSLYGVPLSAGLSTLADIGAQESGKGSVDPSEAALTSVFSALPLGVGEGGDVAGKELAKKIMFNRYNPKQAMLNAPTPPNPELFERMLEEGLQPYFQGFAGGVRNLQKLVSDIEDLKQKYISGSDETFSLDDLKEQAKQKIQDSGIRKADMKDAYNSIDDYIEKTRYYYQNDPYHLASLSKLPDQGQSKMEMYLEGRVTPKDIISDKQAEQAAVKWGRASASQTPQSEAVSKAISRGVNQLMESQTPEIRGQESQQRPYLSLLEAANNRANTGGSNAPLSLTDKIAALAVEPKYMLEALGGNKLLSTPGGAAMIYDASKASPYLGSSLSQYLKTRTGSLDDIYGTGTDYPAER
jgi:hypothetical protein